MRPVSRLGQYRNSIRGVLTDIDDTLTTAGKLTATAYSALWQLKQAGLRLVVVTGRPAGWCDAFARQWPIDGIVGENGAFAFYEEDGHLRELLHPDVADEATSRAKLQRVRDAVLAEVPGSRVAKDQPYRRFDLAIDFREEAPDLGYAAGDAIRRIFVRHGAQAKISSIHVNGWFGNYDKLATTKLLAQRLWGEALDETRAAYVFAGDSPNDAPMFAFFPHACAMANIAPFVDELDVLPTYVTEAAGGLGFAQLTRALVG